jgi:hypothetical protein
MVIITRFLIETCLLHCSQVEYGYFKILKSPVMKQGWGFNFQNTLNKRRVWVFGKIRPSRDISRYPV